MKTAFAGFGQSNSGLKFAIPAKSRMKSALNRPNADSALKDSRNKAQNAFFDSENKKTAANSASKTSMNTYGMRARSQR